MSKNQHTPGRPAGLAEWMGTHGLNIERQIHIVQWALPLVLAGIVFTYEMAEHVISKDQPLSTPNFISEVFFFGLLGPLAVWLVLWWIRHEWHERERDKQALQQMYNELSEAQARLNTLHAQRGELLNRLMSVQEEERRRVAREIHDELGQLLTGLSLNLKLCREAVPDDLPTAHGHLIKASSVVRHTIEQSHRLIVDLRPTVLDDYGLVPALEEEVNQRLTPLGIEAELETRGNMKRLPADVATAAFRIVQEAITNVIRHAKASRVQIKLQQTAAGLTVTVEDDGVGLPEKGLSSLNGHSALGILGMQERAKALTGWLEVAARDPRGTRVYLWLPLQTETA
ncbi:MAG: sensor histidine kinase [Anaerolineae bacterium]